MIGEKRKRVSDPLPPMTIVTRASARRQSIESTPTTPSATKSTNKKSRHGARSSSSQSRAKPTNNLPTSRANRARTRHSHASSMVTQPEKHEEVEHNTLPAVTESSAKPRQSARVSRHYVGGTVGDEDENVQGSKRLRVTKDTDECDDEEEEEEQEEEEDDEEVPRFEYESKYKDDEDANDGTHTELDLVSGQHIDSMAHSLSVMEGFQPSDKLSDFDQLLKTTANSNQGPRWPIDKQDDSTTFSILTNNSASPSSSSSFSKTAFGSNNHPLSLDHFDLNSDTSSIEDFLNYESAGPLTDDESDVSSSSGSSSPVIEAVSFERNIPLCGYRDRNKTAPHNIAALSLPPPACERPKLHSYYQKAIIAATGLNRRSLWSGKAREMVGGAGFELREFEDRF